MDLLFSTSELANACNRLSAMRRRFGEPVAAAVAQQLAELHAVDCLADAAALPHLQISRDGSDVLIEPFGLLFLRARPGPGSGSPTRNRWVKITQLTILDIQPHQNV